MLLQQYKLVTGFAMNPVKINPVSRRRISALLAIGFAPILSLRFSFFVKIRG